MNKLVTTDEIIENLLDQHKCYFKDYLLNLHKDNFRSTTLFGQMIALETLAFSIGLRDVEKLMGDSRTGILSADGSIDDGISNYDLNVRGESL